VYDVQCSVLSTELCLRHCHGFHNASLNGFFWGGSYGLSAAVGAQEQFILVVFSEACAQMSERSFLSPQEARASISELPLLSSQGVDELRDGTKKLLFFSFWRHLAYNDKRCMHMKTMQILLTVECKDESGEMKNETLTQQCPDIRGYFENVFNRRPRGFDFMLQEQPSSLFERLPFYYEMCVYNFTHHLCSNNSRTLDEAKAVLISLRNKWFECVCNLMRAAPRVVPKLFSCECPWQQYQNLLALLGGTINLVLFLTGSLMVRAVKHVESGATADTLFHGETMAEKWPELFVMLYVRYIKAETQPENENCTREAVIACFDFSWQTNSSLCAHCKDHLSAEGSPGDINCPQRYLERFIDSYRFYVPERDIGSTEMKELSFDELWKQPELSTVLRL
jgi:hypothetical protein